MLRSLRELVPFVWHSNRRVFLRLFRQVERVPTEGVSCFLCIILYMSDVSALRVSPERTTHQKHLVDLFIQSKACEEYLLVSALGEGRGAHVEQAVPVRRRKKTEPKSR
jgi:hypothetical protein